MKQVKQMSNGSTRQVYDLGNDKILKLAVNNKGLQCNKSEVLTYLVAPAMLRKNLGYIFSYEENYQWLIMKKYTLTLPQNDTSLKKVRRLQQLFRDHGLTPRDILRKSGPNYNNLRINNKNQIVIIDYGKFINEYNQHL
ncbi:hypothetical protein [Paenibacillus pabuli]|uniref:hypothetical protein n=1 Tax=Paenibacillus pabuli TaxID=1472 RepID=UPI003CEEE2EA